MPTRYFREALAELETEHDIVYTDADERTSFDPQTSSERKLSEYLGSPDTLAREVHRAEILVVHGAPVTAEVLAAGSELRLVGVARGGPVNVDVEAVAARELPLVNTPGKNAEAVADLTMALLVMLARRLPEAMEFLADGNQLADNWEGARFMGADLRGHALGLVGYGQVGQRVAVRAQAFGMNVLVYDPYVAANGAAEQARTLKELLRRSDFVSLHARATSANHGLIDADALDTMKPGAFLINTARESLVDIAALDAALADGRLGGAALDVLEPTTPGQPPKLLRYPNVVLTPHIGGATRETLKQGAEMLGEEIRRFAAGQPLAHVVGPSGVGP